jgi:hypothetical protein
MWLAFVAYAAAGTVDAGVQARLYQPALDAAGAWVSGQTFEVSEPDLGGAYDCWDRIGVRDLSLSVPIDTLSMSLERDGLHLHVELGSVYGAGWTLYTEDEDYLDSCPEYDTAVNYVSFENGVLDAVLDADVEGGELVFTADDVTLDGDLDTDIEDFPDDLVLDFFEDTILAYMASAAAEYAPAMAADFLSEGVLEGEYGAYALALVPTDAGVSDSAVSLAASADVSWTGDDGCPRDQEPRNDGRTPDIVFAGGDGSGLAFGVTEAMLAEILNTLWHDGWFCFNEEDLQEFVTLVQDAFDPAAGGLAATASLDNAPSVSLDEDGATLTLSGMHVGLTATLDGEAVTLLDAAFSLSGSLEPGVDPDLGAVSLGIHDVTLKFDHFDADHLVSQRDHAEDELRNFLETWAGTWADAQTQDFTLFSSTWRLYGLVLRVDRVDRAAGSLTVFLSIYDEDDPAVDDVPPDTTVDVARSDEGVVLEWDGSDDRDGTLTYAWRVDGRPWSTWTTEAGTVLLGIGDGEHTVQVKARDAWWNEDPSPAAYDVEVADLPETHEGCGCGGTGGGPWLLAALLLVRRRR